MRLLCANGVDVVGGLGVLSLAMDMELEVAVFESEKGGLGTSALALTLHVASLSLTAVVNHGKGGECSLGSAKGFEEVVDLWGCC